MEKLPMCRICLVQNVRMYIVVNRNLHKLYEKLTDIPFLTEDRRPILACFVCYTKLIHFCRFLRKCLESEKLIAQMMDADYKPNPLVNQERTDFYSGLTITPVHHISIVDECQTKSITIKKESPAVDEGLVDMIEPKEEYQSDDDVSLMFTIKMEAEEVSKKKIIKKKENPEALSGSRETTSPPVERVWTNQSPASEGAVPVPAAHVTVGGGGDQGTPRRILKAIRRDERALRETESDSAINYGSEDDSEHDVVSGDNDENLGMLFIPRAQRMYFEGEDDVVDDVVASVGQTHQSEAESSPPSPSQRLLSQPSPSNQSSSPIPYSSPLGPTHMFDFEWRSFPVPPVAPAERREVFAEINCGSTAPLLTPYDAFIAIWSRDFMEHIAYETNQYAQALVERWFQDGSLAPANRITHWYDTNADELYVYFGLIVATGICVKSELAEYWSNDEILLTPLFAQFMSLNRFLLLTRCLHFSRNSSDLRRLSRSQAKLYKIAPVVDHLNCQFQNLYRLGRNIVIDESLTQWNELLEFQQLIKNKAASTSIKTYEVREAQTGYLWRFKVHARRVEETEQDATPVSGVIPALVLDLLKGLEYKGRTVWMDSNYSSPALARVLKSLGFDCVGTLRTNNQNVPTQLATLKKSQMAFGEITGCTSGDVDILVWRDQKRVALISTYHGAAVQCLRGQTKPTAIHDYTVCMGGIDRKDEMLSMYPIEGKRTQVWYKRLFRRLLNVSVLNAFIVHKSSVMPDGKIAIKDHREFRKTLISQILGKHKPRAVLTLTPGATKTWKGSKKVVPNVPVLSRDVLQHFPKEYGYIPGRNKEKIRHACVVCSKRVPTFCPACNVALCFVCTINFHNK